MNKNIAQIKPRKVYKDQNSNVIDLNNPTFRKTSLLIFISIYCVRCIELLTNLNKLKSISDLPLIIFSDGDKKENREIGEAFLDQISIISITEEQMYKDFQIKTHPSYIILGENKNFIESGNIINIDALIEKFILHNTGKTF
ncbi:MULTISPECIES: hypothetical protein [Paenibacillus]|uniref:Alkyl hydroperoxide reductase subunit C/ Thiol specific antioxidant domain-containing protein n=1 Tax=Paenibacillus odorifer TaxID=189426 RepID=A0A1R0X384_9BACL|nr:MULTISPECIES: hypothetical protein [Paenibacillus]ETT61191.1 methylamine utilization protein [Paenibacillus sp. FSL H8-237]MEC0134727.1 hypothetical protein [Paenibacillus odorifer]MEC0221916.1 hypothetical protein [Paenibacillus odorifer]OMD26475.1 hypothetical protein BJP48_22855 [Paenibacillus odorifer]OMD27682.1 hypothetical protein BJP51_24510 [Paenibacillus odorifer]